MKFLLTLTDGREIRPTTPDDEIARSDYAGAIVYAVAPAGTSHTATTYPWHTVRELTVWLDS